MNPVTTRYVLVLLSAVVLVGGNLSLWLLFPTILDKLGGINIVSLSLGMLFFSTFVLSSAFLFRYTQGKPIRRWQMEVAQAYVGLAILIALGFVFDTILPSDVLFIWPFVILPLATMLVAFYLLRRIPKIKKKFDEMSKDW